MSDPKTSQSNLGIPIQDRIYVVGNASFICFIVAVLWTVLFIGKSQLSISTLIVLAAPLIATGITVVIGGAIKDLVPKSTLSVPLNLTIPLIWCLCCYLAVSLISTQETGSTRVPEPLIPSLVWSKIYTLLPVFIGQVLALSGAMLFTKEPKEVE